MPSIKIGTDVAAKNLADQNWHSEGHLTRELKAHDHCNQKSLIRGKLSRFRVYGRVPKRGGR
jgi:hypothetical protein